MHDPLTVAFTIKNPLLPSRRLSADFKYRPPLVTIWHRDPEVRGDDDSCDWFGKRRRLNAREARLNKAIADLHHVLGNRPFWPHTDLYGVESSDSNNGAPMHELARAAYEWRRARLRWHPRWHVWHWHLQIHPVQHFKRWAFSRCSGCGGRFGWAYAPVSDSWDGSGPRWFRNGERVRHGDCTRPTDSILPGFARPLPTEAKSASVRTNVGGE